MGAVEVQHDDTGVIQKEDGVYFPLPLQAIFDLTFLPYAKPMQDADIKDVPKLDDFDKVIVGKKDDLEHFTNQDHFEGQQLSKKKKKVLKHFFAKKKRRRSSRFMSCTSSKSAVIETSGYQITDSLTESPLDHESISFSSRMSTSLQSEPDYFDQNKIILDHIRFEANSINQRMNEMEKRKVTLHEEVAKCLLNAKLKLKECEAQLLKAEKEMISVSHNVIKSQVKLGKKNKHAGFKNFSHKSKKMITTETHDMVIDEKNEVNPLSPITLIEPVIEERTASFVRINDLEISKDIKSFKLPPNIPSTTADSNLTTSDYYHLDSQETPIIFEAILKLGMQCAVDGKNEGLMPWKPMDETKKILTKREKNNLKVDADIAGWVVPHGNEVLVWSSKFTHGKYGCELPVVKARGIVQTSPLKLVELLLDSSRVKEYNKMSLGRTDDFVFQEGLNTVTTQKFGNESVSIRGEVKIIRSLSKAPLVKKPIELLSLIHARELLQDQDDIDDSLRGYLIITRAILEDTSVQDNSKNKEETSRSEMLLGVNLVRYIDDDDEENCSRAEFTTITQMYSPLVPMMVAKRIGLSSAANFIRDIQKIFDGKM